jgi:hypothetical protein
MPHIPIKTDVVQHFITRHLDMYLPSSINDTLLGLPLEVPEPEYVDATSEGDIVKLEDLEEAANIPTSDGMGIPHRSRTMDSVIEEDEEDQ